MKKRSIVAIIAGIMMISAMGGCGGNGIKENSSAAATDAVDGKDEPYTVTMLLRGEQQPDEERIEKAMNKILEKELNAKIDIVMLPWSNATQQLQLMLSGDEKLDLFYATGEESVPYVNSGQVLDMSEYLDKYGDNLKEIYGEDVMKINNIEGYVYGTPVQIERGSIPAIFLRKDILEKYDIDVSKIKEPKDMDAVFEKVKVGEPDMTMLYSTNGGNLAPVNRLFGGDDLTDHFGVLMDPVNDAKVENFYETQWFKDTTKMLYDWTKKGYISKDAATNPDDWTSMMKAGNLFSIITIYHPGSIVEFESTTNQEFECITFQDDPVITSSSYNEIVFSLARNSENPDKAIEVLDYIYGSPELMNLLNWGEEGTDYVIEDKENGIINYPEGKNADSVGYSMNSGWELPNQFIAYKWHGSEPDLWEQLEDFNNNAKESKAAGFTFDNTEYADQLSALNNVVSQYGGSLLSGTGDPDTYISKFLKALKDAGIDDVIDGKKKQLDIWIEKQK